MPLSSATPAYAVADFDFDLPPELIAQHPAAERTASRLLDATGAEPVDRVFRELPGLLSPGDLLVFNNTRVIKARLYGAKATGGNVEALVERVLPGTQEVWMHLRASKSPKPGSRVRFADAVRARYRPLEADRRVIVDGRLDVVRDRAGELAAPRHDRSVDNEACHCALLPRRQRNLSSCGYLRGAEPLGAGGAAEPLGTGGAVELLGTGSAEPLGAGSAEGAAVEVDGGRGAG